MKLKSVPEDFIVREHWVPSFAPGPYRVFLLLKREGNTEDCLQDVSRKLHIARKHIACCGNKDKQAVTEQYVTIRNAPALIHTPPSYSLTCVGTRADPLFLGAHERNFFTITVRELTQQPQLVAVRNLFGSQRFSERNDEIGFALLRKEYAQAATLLGLSFTSDPIAALRTLPKSTLVLYAHAAQSALWNEMALELPLEQQLVPLPGFAPTGTAEQQAMMERVLAKHNLSFASFVNRSLPELSLEGGERALLQDVQDVSMSTLANGVCVLSFSLAKGHYATETVKAFCS